MISNMKKNLQKSVQVQIKKMKKPLDYLKLFVQQFKNILQNATVSPLNILRIQSEDIQVNPETVKLIKVLMNHNIKHLRDTY